MDITPDYFYCRLIVKNDEIIDLPITAPFIPYIPQIISYIQKKGIVFKDKRNIINAIVENKNLFDYIHNDKENEEL